MPNFPFVVGDSLQIGSATISATGNAIVLPTGTSVGGTQVATTQEVATGGGPKITNLQITDNSWAVLDDTAVDTAGGYILITGTNFVSGALVYFNQTPATSVAFVSTTSLRVTVPALTAGTYIVYVINPDGGTAIRVPGLTASANPAWQTASALPEQYDGVAITLNLVATDANSYTLVSGSLPPGLSLNSNTGVITGTVTGVTVDTTYTFTVRATDAQLQDSPRTFTVTITVSDAYFKLTTLLLSGSAISANTVIRDSSTNNFNLTVSGDARASNFTPYGTGWSVYFDGTGDYLELATNTAFDLPGDYTIEFWMYLVVLATNANYYVATRGTYQSGSQDWYIALDQANKGISFVFGPSSSIVLYAGVIPVNTWTHVAFSRSGSTARSFLNGVLRSSITDTTNLTNTRSLRIGADSGATINNLFSGYLSNWRIIKGTALYTANFTPATTTLTSVANTSLLTCHVNRFIDSSTNNFTITRNGDAAIQSFNPFNITNTGVNGSAYFDGTGDVIKLPASNNFAVGTGAFCVEFWSYVISLQNYRLFFSSRPDNGGYADALHFGYDGNGGAGIYSNADLLGAPAGTIRVKEWQHIVVCRNSSNVTSIFVNGLRVGSGTVTSNFTRNLFGIGDFPTTQSEPHFGYMADFRFVKGSTPYDPTQLSITVPTQPLTAIADTQLLTLQYDQPHNNHTFLDSSSNQFLITRNGNATQGTFSPFSHTGFSLYTNGTNSYASVPYDASRSLGTGDFSIECWIQLIRQPANYSRIFSIQGGWGVAGHYGIELSMQTIGNNMEVIIAIQGTTVYGSNVIVSPASNYLNRWNHVVITRSSGVVRTFLNGALVTAGNNTTNINGTLATTFGCSQFPGDYSEMLISNFRLVRNSVPTQYQTSSTIPGTQIFTPPTNKVTTTSQGAVAGDVKLLLWQENRFIENASNVTISAFNTPRITPFGPFSDTIYSPAVHSGSAYFDGTGDYIDIASNAYWNFGDGTNFTIELWAYTNNLATQYIIWSNAGTNSSGYNNAYIYTNGTIGIGKAGVNEITSAASTWVSAQWNHLAFVRNGSNLTIFYNGVSVASTASASTYLNNATAALSIGRNYQTSVAYFAGYISNYRVVKGTAVYTANFTPPTAPVTATTNTSLLLNFTDAAILDSTGCNVIETVGDAKSSSVITKFTGGSMYFDGTGDYATIPASESFTLRTADFTVECWIYFVNFNNQQFVGTLSTNSTTSWAFYVQGSNLIFSNWNVTALSYSTASMTTSTWYHVATTRQSGTFRLFVNGTVVNSNTPAAQDYSSTQTLYIGDDVAHTALGAFTGYISDLRITKGYARYTANFTAPTAPARLK